MSDYKQVLEELDETHKLMMKLDDGKLVKVEGNEYSLFNIVFR
jgi:hypothetical protein